MNFSIISLIFFLGLVDLGSAAEWNYGDQGPDVWSDVYPLCAGHAQSPIDIKTGCTIYQSFDPFEFSSTYNQIQNFTLINNGHSISGDLTNENSSPLILTGGGLMGKYQFSSFHFHWGENYKSGSEHQINNRKYSGELHLIHINPITTQTTVLGIFLHSTKETIDTTVRKRKRQLPNSLEWEKLFASADDLQRINQTTTINFNLRSLINIDFSRFWRYTGSLTTPPCTEGIIWSVFKQTITVTDNQFRFFRADIHSKVYREPQPLNHRIVYRSFPNEVTSTLCRSN